MATRRRQLRIAIQALLDQYHATYELYSVPLNDAIADAVIDLLINAKKKASKRKRGRKKPKTLKVYPRTALTVKELCEMPYRKYLETDHWEQTRKEALRLGKYKCHLCDANGCELHIHHLTYERRGCERQSDLMVLCKPCHEKVHEEAREQHKSAIAK